MQAVQLDDYRHIAHHSQFGLPVLCFLADLLLSQLSFGIRELHGIHTCCGRRYPRPLCCSATYDLVAIHVEEPDAHQVLTARIADLLQEIW
jgi:hypothetical protein